MRFGWLAVSLTLALSACKSDDPSTADFWLDKLDQYSQRVEALRNLGRIGDKKAIPEIVKWLQKEGDWQPEAALTLGALGDASVAPELIGVMTPGAQRADRDKNRLNAAAARALAMLKAPEGAAAIRKLLGSADDRVREQALHSLGQLRDSASVDLVIDAALNEKSPLVRLAALQALGEMGDVKGVPALVQLLFLEEGGASFYEAARMALMKVGQPAVPELIRTLTRQNPAVEAIRLQVQLPGKPVPDSQPIPDGIIEAKAASTLGAIGAKSAEPQIVTAFERLYTEAQKNKQSSAYNAVIELAYALGSLGTQSAAQALVPMAKDPDAGFRLAACESLVVMGSKDVAPELIAAAKTGADDARGVAVVAASRLGRGEDLAAFDELGKTAGGELARLVQSERPRLVAAQECGTDKACWKKKLADASPKVRDRAAYELGWLGAKDSSADLLKSLEDPDVEVRMASVLAIERLGDTDMKKLQAVYDQWQSRVEYAGVNQELLRVISRLKAKK